MRKNQLAFILTASVFLFPCSENEQNTINVEETPAALQDNKVSISSYSKRGDDLIEELYQELVEKSTDLKKLEESTETENSLSSEQKNIFEKYNQKSNSYYASAEYKTQTISDSILKKQLLAIIALSKETYTSRTKELNSLVEMISKNEKTLNDKHIALKILLTLPVIEKYQKANLPDKASLKKVLNDQEKLIKKIDSVTPKY
mgnify:CR=1 FL=1